MRLVTPLNRNWTKQRSGSNDIMADVFGDFDNVFNNFLSQTPMSLQMSCDVDETDKHLLVSFDVPGVKKDDISIKLENNRLTVSAERKRDWEESKSEGIIREKSYGRFERSFTLPSTVDGNEIEAHYDNGVLNLAIPKKLESKGKEIPVKSGEQGFFSRLMGKKEEKN